MRLLDKCFIQRLLLYCFTRLNFCSVSILANAFPSCCPTEFGERNEASEGNIISSQVMISSHFLFCGTSIYYSQLNYVPLQPKSGWIFQEFVSLGWVRLVSLPTVQNSFRLYYKLQNRRNSDDYIFSFAFAFSLFLFLVFIFRKNANQHQSLLGFADISIFPKNLGVSRQKSSSFCNRYPRAF